MGEVRMGASVAVVRGQVKCLLERLGLLGLGEAGAGKRRRSGWRKSERQAYQLAHIAAWAWAGLAELLYLDLKSEPYMKSTVWSIFFTIETCVFL